MATNFADGTKISFEQAVTANGVGMCVARRGMLGYEHRGHVDELTTRYDVDELRAFGGIVDYVIGAAPGPGIFVLAAATQAWQPAYLRLYKMGDGPLYSFYAPFHLCHFEMPFTVARVALRGDAALAPLAGPRVEVVATAKRDLKVGETLTNRRVHGLRPDGERTGGRRRGSPADRRRRGMSRDAPSPEGRGPQPVFGRRGAVGPPRRQAARRAGPAFRPRASRAAQAGRRTGGSGQRAA